MVLYSWSGEDQPAVLGPTPCSCWDVSAGAAPSWAALIVDPSLSHTADPTQRDLAYHG